MSMYPNSDHVIEDSTTRDISAETKSLHDAGLPANHVQQIAAIAANVKGASDDAELDRRGRETASALERRYGIAGASEALDGAATLAGPVLETLKKLGVHDDPRVVAMFAERFMKSRGK